MESTGVPNRIHVSQDFVSSLENQGKGHWVTARKDSIYAKGKGQLQTYFLVFKQEGSHAYSDTASSNGYDSPSPSKAKGSGIEEPTSGLVESSVRDHAKTERLIDWNVDLLTSLLKEIVASRQAHGIVPQPEKVLCEFEMQQTVSDTQNVIAEVQEVIKLPEYRRVKDVDPNSITLDEIVVNQLRLFVTNIAGLYQDNPFHNFEHASHVTMSVVSFLQVFLCLCSRISAHSHLAAFAPHR